MADSSRNTLATCRAGFKLCRSASVPVSPPSTMPPVPSAAPQGPAAPAARQSQGSPSSPRCLGLAANRFWCQHLKQSTLKKHETKQVTFKSLSQLTKRKVKDMIGFWRNGRSGFKTKTHMVYFLFLIIFLSWNTSFVRRSNPAVNDKIYSGMKASIIPALFWFLEDPVSPLNSYLAAPCCFPHIFLTNNLHTDRPPVFFTMQQTY